MPSRRGQTLCSTSIAVCTLAIKWLVGTGVVVAFTWPQGPMKGVNNVPASAKASLARQQSLRRESWQNSPVHASSPVGSSLVGASLALLVASIGGGAPPALADGGPGGPAWDYSDGGASWNKEFADCKKKFQTPIDLKKKIIEPKGDDSLWTYISYKPSDTDLFNNKGKNVQANGEFGQLRLPDGDYEAIQFHFHFPAEHSINDFLPAGEMHIVHQKIGSEGTDDLAVIGIFLEDSGNAVFGKEGVFMTKLGFGTELPGEGLSKNIQGIDLNAFSDEYKGGFYHYKGSLTTPPCSETVHWYLAKKAARITKGMADSFKARFPANNRAIMPLNGRMIAESDMELPGEFLNNWPFRQVY